MRPNNKQCCVPHCPNLPESSKKQFFRIVANIEARRKWRIGSTVTPKSQILYCCQDHFDLPNDAVNYIRYKYCPGTVLKLRPNVLPNRRMPQNVCRLCLNLIYNSDDMVEVSRAKGSSNAKIVSTLLPEIDLSLSVDPVLCMRCFDPLEKTYKIKQSVLRNEVVVMNCIKSIVKRSPKRMVKKCEIDLFDEYNDIKELLKKEKYKEKFQQQQKETPEAEVITAENKLQVWETSNERNITSNFTIEEENQETTILQISEPDDSRTDGASSYETGHTVSMNISQTSTKTEHAETLGETQEETFQFEIIEDDIGSPNTDIIETQNVVEYMHLE